MLNRSDKLLVVGVHLERSLFLSLTPDRVYILKGFPATETDAAQFLEENNAYYTAPTKKRKSAASPPPPRKPDNRPAFLSSLDAVVQLTTRYEKLELRCIGRRIAEFGRGVNVKQASSCYLSAFGTFHVLELEHGYQ